MKDTISQAEVNMPEMEVDAPCTSFLVQIGDMGIFGIFHLQDPQLINRIDSGDWAVCQTGRGPELGKVKSIWKDESVETRDFELSGTVLRKATAEDHLAMDRLTKNKDLAIEHCNKWLKENGFSDLMIEAETTLDGEKVFFHFLGPMSPQLNEKTEQLTKQYDKIAKVKQFTEAVELGCGPDCGSNGSGCATGGGCSSCGLKSNCHSKSKD